MLLMLAALLAANVMALVIAVHTLRVSAAPRPDSCAICGYPTIGLPSFVCPECGRDRREVGSTARREKRKLFWVVAPLFYLPAAALVSLLTTAVSASIALGHWPVPNLDDPQYCLTSGFDAMAFYALTGWAWGQVLVLPFCIVARERCFARHVIGYVVFNLLCGCVLLCPPCNLLAWYLD